MNGCNSPPFGIPASVADLFRRGFYSADADDTDLVNLRVTTYSAPNPVQTSHGPELALGLAMAATLPPTSRAVIVRVTANSTAVTDWIEGGSFNAKLQTAITDAKARLAARYPGATVRWHLTVAIGGIEGGAAQPNNSAAVAMAANLATLLTQIETYTGQATIIPYVVVEGDSISAQTYLTEERASESSFATGHGGIAVNIDSFDAYQSDGRHYTGTVQNQVGALEATHILTWIAAHPHQAANDNGAGWPALYALPPERKRRRRRLRRVA